MVEADGVGPVPPGKSELGQHSGTGRKEKRTGLYQGERSGAARVRTVQMAYALQERMPQIMETRLLMIVMVPLAPDELRMGCSGMDAARTELLPKSTHW